MSSKVLKTEIAFLIETIGEQYETIDNHEVKIPQIEIDLLMENVRRLYDCLYHLNKHNEGVYIVSNSEPTDYQDVKLMEPAISEVSSSDVKNEMATDIIHLPEEKIGPKVPLTNIQQEIPAPSEEPVIQVFDSKPIYHDEKPVEIKRPVSEVKKMRPVEVPKTIDLFSTPVTVADKFHEATDNVASKMLNHQISDLKTAIGINDKFLFINDLFDGNMKSYNNSIEILNNFQSFADAEAHIEKIKTDGNRVRNIETIGRLTELVKRRYL